MSVMKNIGYSEFVRLCNVDDPEEWCGWLSLRLDGLYVKPLSPGLILTPLERSVLTEHPLHDLTKPVLAFPCSFEELQAFDENQGLGLGLDGADKHAQQAAPAGEPLPHAIKGVTTAEIDVAFGGLVDFKLRKAMTDRAAWTLDARISTGTKGGRHKSLWNPVILATALAERKRVSLPRLNQAFSTCKFLARWREEWDRFSTM